MKKLRKKLSRNAQEALYGLAFLLVAVGAFVLVVEKEHAVDADLEEGMFEMQAMFGRTNGLHIGDDVRIAGVRVGKIVKEELQSDYRVNLTMLLDKDYKIPEDSSAMIESDSLMGKKYVDITLGAEDVPLAFGESLIYTQDAMVLEELIDLVVNYAEQKQEKMADECKKMEQKK